LIGLRSVLRPSCVFPKIALKIHTKETQNKTANRLLSQPSAGFHTQPYSMLPLRENLPCVNPRLSRKNHSHPNCCSHSPPFHLAYFRGRQSSLPGANARHGINRWEFMQLLLDGAQNAHSPVSLQNNPTRPLCQRLVEPASKEEIIHILRRLKMKTGMRPLWRPNAV